MGGSSWISPYTGFLQQPKSHMAAMASAERPKAAFSTELKRKKTFILFGWSQIYRPRASRLLTRLLQSTSLKDSAPLCPVVTILEKPCPNLKIYSLVDMREKGPQSPSKSRCQARSIIWIQFTLAGYSADEWWVHCQLAAFHALDTANRKEEKVGGGERGRKERRQGVETGILGWYC